MLEDDVRLRDLSATGAQAPDLPALQFQTRFEQILDGEIVPRD